MWGSQRILHQLWASHSASRTAGSRAELRMVLAGISSTSVAQKPSAVMVISPRVERSRSSGRSEASQRKSMSNREVTIPPSLQDIAPEFVFRFQRVAVIASLHLILQLCFHGMASRSDCPDVLREVSPLLYADQTLADTFSQQLQGFRSGDDS